MQDVLIELRGQYVNEDRGKQVEDLGKRETIVPIEELLDFVNNETLKDAFCRVADIEPKNTMDACVMAYLQKYHKGIMRSEETIVGLDFQVNGTPVDNYDAKAKEFLEKDESFGGREYNALAFDIVTHMKGG